MQKISSLVGLALGFGYLIGGQVVSATSCNADNCLRALFPTQSLAAYSSDAAFCATFTTSVNTMTTGFPSRASAACGTAASRYSSACSCRPTISSTLSSATSKTSSSTSTSTTPLPCASTPESNIVRNPGFECGLSPWIAEDIVNTRHSITSPGDNSAFAYQFNQVGPIGPDANYHPASVSQNLTVVVGSSYTLTFRVFFDKCTQSEGFVGVMIGPGGRDGGQTVDACDGGTSNFKTSYAVKFTASTNPENLRFEFLVGETDAVARIDNVVVLPS